MPGVTGQVNRGRVIPHPQVHPAKPVALAIWRRRGRIPRMITASPGWGILPNGLSCRDARSASNSPANQSATNGIAGEMAKGVIGVGGGRVYRGDHRRGSSEREQSTITEWKELSTDGGMSGNNPERH